MGQARDVGGDSVRTVDEIRFNEQDRCAGIGELMPEIFVLVRGVDRHRDTAGEDDAPPGEHRLGRILNKRGDPAAPSDAKFAEECGDAAASVVDLGCGDLRADNIQVLAFGVPFEACVQQLDDRAFLAVVDPDPVAHQSLPSQTTKARSTTSCRPASGSRSRGLGSSETTAGSSAWYADMMPLKRRASTSGSPSLRTPPRWPRRKSDVCSCMASSYRSFMTRSISRSVDKAAALEYRR